ncbi:MAG TPA: menaquinone biosynthesis protein [Bacteroidales bacterium]|nr:menaquinone biosynthesis protein [Bacteroidales bacterium]
MSSPIRIAAVSYANTFPFVYGIENSGIPGSYQLILLPPAQCAVRFAAGEADIALVPAGSLPELPEHKIITDYCIAAVSEVKTVLLLSNKNNSEIKSIGLDLESATSVRLVKILARYYWNINPEWQPINIADYKDHSGIDAFVVIGDKAIGLSGQFKYKRDLASEWQKFMNLPFVFAVWICRKDLPNAQIRYFSSVLKFGIDHIDDAVKKYQDAVGKHFDLDSYYRNNIDYLFDQVKKNSLQKFLNFVSDIDYC